LNELTAGAGGTGRAFFLLALLVHFVISLDFIRSPALSYHFSWRVSILIARWFREHLTVGGDYYPETPVNLVPNEYLSGRALADVFSSRMAYNRAGRKSPKEAKMRRLNKGLVLVLALALSAGVAAGDGCMQRAEFAAPPPAPFIPAAYFKCIQADALTLIDAYYINYNSPAQVAAKYNGEVFVFKGVTLTDKQIASMKKGYVFVEMIKCAITNTDDVSRYKAGDRIDVVGINQGISMDFRGLEFSDCYIIPSGSMQLPSGGEGGQAISGY
jgi:hypothetical protein